MIYLQEEYLQVAEVAVVESLFTFDSFSSIWVCDALTLPVVASSTQHVVHASAACASSFYVLLFCRCKKKKKIRSLI